MDKRINNEARVARQMYGPASCSGEGANRKHVRLIVHFRLNAISLTNEFSHPGVLVDIQGLQPLGHTPRRYWVIGEKRDAERADVLCGCTRYDIACQHRLD